MTGQSRLSLSALQIYSLAAVSLSLAGYERSGARYRDGQRDRNRQEDGEEEKRIDK